MNLNDIRNWDVDALEQLRTAMAKRITTLADVGDQLAAIRNFPGWEGAAVDAARRQFQVTEDGLIDEAATLGAVQRLTERTIDAVSVLKRELREVEDDVAAEGFMMDGGGRIWGDAVPPGDLSDAERAAREQRKAELEARAVALVAQAEDIASDAAEVLNRAADGAISDNGATTIDAAYAAGAEQGNLTAPAPTEQMKTDPAAANAYWQAMPEEQHREVIAKNPEWIGNLDGIPSEARHEANVNRIDSERARLEERESVLESETTGVWNTLSNEYFGDRDAELEYVRMKLDDLDTIEGILDENPLDADHPNGARLLLLDMESGERGMAAIAIGDPDTANHISVAVPGVDTGIGSLGGMVDEAAALREETVNQLDRLNRNETVASIAWLGYEPPITTGPGNIGIPGTDIDIGRGWGDAIQTDRATDAAPDLARFYAGLDVASAQPDPHITALGHSYGSYTTALALQDPGPGQPVDDAVFYGSPGINADDEADLGLDDGHGFVMRSPDDPIAGWTPSRGTFGPDPVETDLVQLSVKETTTPDGVQREDANGHSEYPRPSDENGPFGGELRTSGYNMAIVVAGLTDPSLGLLVR